MYTYSHIDVLIYSAAQLYVDLSNKLTYLLAGHNYQL